MNALRKYLGLVWMILGPIAILWLIQQAWLKLSQAGSTFNDILQWGIIILIFVPIALGMSIFGYYAWQDEYKLDD